VRCRGAGDTSTVNSTFREIIRHATVFGFGAILARLASIALLPLYTRYLTPADYGVMAIIDLTVSLLSIVVGGGIASAATRSHFAEAGESYLDRVWSTAIAAVIGAATFVLGPAVLARRPLAAIAFGPDLVAGPGYLLIAFATLWLGSIAFVVESYFRSLKASSFLVAVNFSRLLVNIFLNVLFVVGFQMGVVGVLWGNLVAAAFAIIVQGAVLLRTRRHFAFDRDLLGIYWQFGWPLVVYGLLAVIMHEADRFVLRLFVGLDEVGRYAIAYQIGQGVNSLVIVPFTSIWIVIVYQIANEPDAVSTYARVFKHFVKGLALVLLLASLCAEPILRLIAPPEYAGAADIVPVVCLAYLLFSLHEHFKVPALLSGRTTTILPVVAVAAVTNVGLNFVLIPWLGAIGAAWATVATFGVFSLGGLLQYRRIARYPYPFRSATAVILGMVGSYLVYRFLARSTPSLTLRTAIAVAMWAVWALAVWGRHARDLLHATRGLDHILRPGGVPQAAAGAGTADTAPAASTIRSS
jgi:O-antigen/teichoic acid export membrane protein